MAKRHGMCCGSICHIRVSLSTYPLYETTSIPTNRVIENYFHMCMSNTEPVLILN